MTPAEWIALVGVMLVPVTPIFALLFRLSNKLAALDANVVQLLKSVNENHERDRRIWKRLDEHTERIGRLEGQQN
jgi:hypothetical protein